jgi:general secretion pathway protein G
MHINGMKKIQVSVLSDRPAPGQRPPRSRQHGFTLLELVMVMTIIVILAAVGITSYQHIRQKAQETILKENLRQMRKLIDQYGADKEKLPQSLNDLVPDYIREVPIDPMTGDKNWHEDMGEDTYSREGGSGLVDVHSSAVGEGEDGTPYSEY